MIRGDSSSKFLSIPTFWVNNKWNFDSRNFWCLTSAPEDGINESGGGFLINVRGQVDKSVTNDAIL